MRWHAHNDKPLLRERMTSRIRRSLVVVAIGVSVIVSAFVAATLFLAFLKLAAWVWSV